MHNHLFNDEKGKSNVEFHSFRVAVLTVKKLTETDRFQSG